MELIANRLGAMKEQIEQSRVPPQLVKAAPKAVTSSARGAKGNPSCWRCQGVRYLVVKTEDGRSAAKPCLCLRRARIREALALVPPRFESPRIARLKACAECHPKQAEVIADLKARPDESYLFSGRNGVGKSHFAWALYRHALARGRRVVACTVRELLADFRRAEVMIPAEGRDLDSGIVVKPRVEASDLKQRERKWTIFLDEFEKARPSEFASEMLLALLDAALEFEHQLIVTSNLSPKRLIEHWGRIDHVWGTSIVRRLENCALWELW